MALATHAEGTQTTVANTEHFLGTDPDSTDGAYQIVIDTTPMTRTDTLKIRLYEAALTTDVTSPRMATIPLYGEQVDPLFVSPAFVLLNRWRISIECNAVRNIKWSIRKVS